MPQGENLPHADELMRLLFQQSSEHAAMLLDPTGQIIAWYKGAETTFGYAPHEVLGQSVSMLFTPENLAAGMDAFERAVARTDVEAEDDRWMLRKDGSRFWASGVLTPIRNAAGQLVAFGKILRNRTDVRAKTAALTKQNEMLRQADERKNQFIGTLAHELRNPLASIVHAAELLKCDQCSREEVEFVASTLERELDSLRRLVDDLIDVTRISVGKVQLNTQRHELAPIVESAVASCRGGIDDRTHKLHVILPAVPLVVMADAVRLRQVFVNLIQNAAKFTQHGGVIWVRLSVEANEAVLKVEDNGIGIAPDVLPRIFDLFTQADLVGDRADVGLGIGLSVVKDLTTLHGGSVQVRSDGIGKGSEFVVRLPLAEARTDEFGSG